MKKFLKSDKGFTLVELMVVVAIIGILSAVAIPNFKKYQAKSKQSEAKIALAALYTAEAGSSADYDTYATCIAALGYETPAKGYYKVGFKAADTTTAGVVTAKGAACPSAAATDANVTPTTFLKANGSATTIAAGDLLSIDPNSSGFTASAAGNISVAAAKDVWTITNGKDVSNPTPGY